MKKTEHIKRYEQGITSKFAVYCFPYVYDFSIYAIDIFFILIQKTTSLAVLKTLHSKDSLLVKSTKMNWGIISSMLKKRSISTVLIQ